MAALLIGNAKLATGPPPFRAMRRDAPPAGACARDEMRQLVPQGAIDFGVSMFAQPRVQRDERAAAADSPSCGAEPWIPFHAHE